MKVKELRKMLDLLDNEDAEVYIAGTSGVENDYWDHRVDNVIVVNRAYVHPEKKLIAKRPCKITENSLESLVIYV